MAIRTIVYLSLDWCDFSEEQDMMNNSRDFPALDLETRVDGKPDLSLLLRYLTRHKRVTKHCKFYLYKDDYDSKNGGDFYYDDSYGFHYGDFDDTESAYAKRRKVRMIISQ